MIYKIIQGVYRPDGYVAYDLLKDDRPALTGATFTEVIDYLRARLQAGDTVVEVTGKQHAESTLTGAEWLARLARLRRQMRRAF